MLNTMPSDAATAVHATRHKHADETLHTTQVAASHHLTSSLTPTCCNVSSRRESATVPMSLDSCLGGSRALSAPHKRVCAG